MKRLSILLGLLALAGCTDTGLTFVTVPVEAQGATESTFVQDGWSVVLTKAELGLGPLYLCATAGANTEFCEAATLEFLKGTTIDGLDPAPQAIGELLGTTGTVRSAFFDYGIPWLLTQTEPMALEGVPGGPATVPVDDSDYVPAGHSARFSGSATCTGGAAVCCPDNPDDCPATFDFQANLDIVALGPGNAAVNGVETEWLVTESPVKLTLRFDPLAWWQEVDFARLAALDDTSSNPVTLDAQGADYAALVISMTSSAVPAFEWTTF